MSLPLHTKVLYGTGDWSISSFNTLRQIFFAIVLTDVVGLEPRLASFAVLAGVLWDALNDPLVGSISDRTRTSMGRRRPFLILFAVPFGLMYAVLWWAPPWESQWALALYVTGAYMVSDLIQSLVSIPFYAMTPELTPDYDERTSITSWRMFFNQLASLAVAVVAPGLVEAMQGAGFTAQQGYVAVAALFGVLAVFPILAIGIFVHEDAHSEPLITPPLLQSLRAAWANVPFRYLTALNMLNWISFDLVGLMMPFFVTYQLAGGELGAKTGLLGFPLAMASAMLGVIIVSSLAAIPLWVWLSRPLGKRLSYALGAGIWALMQLAMFTIGPGEVGYALSLSAVAGVGIAAAHVLPDAMIPDVVDWEEWKTGARSEAVYYGTKNLVRKLSGAVSVFVALQVLGWVGYVQPAADAVSSPQPALPLLAIRLLTGPAGAVLLVGAIVAALLFPLTRAKHRELQVALKYRREASR
ncbi:MAG: MFS transporter [Deltaproteobacteria bacterium]|nr:MFS transporter [Deltaproteobacteria bacterium]